MREHRIIVDEIMALLGNQCLRLTPTALFFEVKKKFPQVRRIIFRDVVKSLVTKGVLVYTNQQCTSHLEMGCVMSRQVSDRIVLATDGSRYQASPGQVIVTIKPGAAFGSGDHPTTCLCLRGMDYLIESGRLPLNGSPKLALDVGTGSGVLAIAAAHLGIDKVIALDLDPVACREAQESLFINRVEDNVAVYCGELSSLSVDRLDLVMANLRPPTLVSLMPDLAKRMAGGGCWVLSGFRPESFESLRARLPVHMDVIWNENDRNWAAMAVQLN